MAARDSNLASRFPHLTALALKEIIDTDMDDEDLINFLNMAYYATRPLAGELGQCGGKSAEGAIIKVLAAHYLTMYDQQPLRVSSGEWSVTYRGGGGQGLAASTYGQQAMSLDCSGKLSEKAAGLRAAKLTTITYYDMQDDETTAVL